MAQRDPKNKERKKSPITTARTTLQALTSRDTLFKLHVFCLITLLTALSVDSCVPSFRESDLRYRYVYRHFLRLDLGGMQPGPQNSQQQIASHLSLHIIFLVHDTCPRDHTNCKVLHYQQQQMSKHSSNYLAYTIRLSVPYC